MSALAAVLLLLAAGLPLGYALTRALPLALVIAPLAGAALATVAVLLMLAAGGPLLLWVAALLLLTGFLAWRRRGGPAAPHGSWRDAGLLTVPLVPPFLPIVQQPVTWDAHLIWWLHAGYFAEGGGFARDAIGNPALGFSHPDYPPLASAPVSLVWQVLGTRDFYPAALVTGALTFSAIAALVYAVRLVTAAGPAPVSWLAAIAAGYSVWSPGWVIPTAGFSDAMCAAAFAAGAVLLLFGREPFDRRTLPLTMLLLCSAALMKNEGLSMVGALAVVGTVKYRREIRRLGWVWLPVGAAGVWSVAVKLLGAETDVLSGGRFGDLLRGDPDTVGRLPLIFETMAGRVDRIVPLALAAAVLGLLLLRRRRRDLGLGGDGWLWAVSALHWAGLTLIYVVTPNDLHWHLATSVDRVVIPAVVLSCASAACWAVVALHRPAAAVPAPAEPAGAAPAQR